MDYQSIIDKYYNEENALRHILLVHSRKVADLSLALCDMHPELYLDRAFVEEGAMLHDIGIFRCNAPGIHCYGTEPYLAHGMIGAELLRAEGYPRHARVCERHTGAGLTREEIVEQHLPLPPQDFLPETLEEQLICYADNFFSKTHLDVQKTPEHVIRSLQRYGDYGVERFRQWYDLFGITVI